MPVTLRESQVAGIQWLKRTQRGILADAFGMGKTVQAIHAACLPVLVTCPTYLVDQWADAIKSERPDARVAVAKGERWERIDAIKAQAEWTIINVEMTRSYQEELGGLYATLIVDEAHHVRGRHARQSQEVQKLAARIPNVYLLTATPVVREIDDFFQLLAILDEKRFSSYHKFVNRYCNMVSNGFSNQVVGAKDKAGLIELLKPYILRRTYQQTGLELPPTVPFPVRLKASTAWHKTYRELKNNYRLQTITFDNASAMVRTLRRLTFDLKQEAAKEIYKDNKDIVFYVYYRESAHAIAEYLGIPAITGEQEPSVRLALAKAGGAFVATISSLKEGCDLTHLTNICFLEQSYLPGDRSQAVARLRRWSPHIRPISVFDVGVQGTIDETITRTIARRQADNELILRTELERDDSMIESDGP